MASEDLRHYRTRENPQIVERYNIVKSVGQGIFADSQVVQTGVVADKDIVHASDFIAEAAKKAHPVVFSSFWSHYFLASELGKRIADQAHASGFEGINPTEIEFLLQLHDLGRVIDPRQYFRNDTWTDRLLSDFGIDRKSVV